jgi:heat shock protein HtpX
VVGVWLIVHVGSFVPDLVGVIAILTAFALRPKFRGLGRYQVPVKATDMPHLNRLIGEVATATRAPRPHTLLFTTSFNAGSGCYGLRRRRFVEIGLPLWLSLTPQERVALLGHELGHFVNGDVRRGPLTRFAFDFFDTLVALSTPAKSRPGSVGMRASGAVGDMLSRWLMWIVRWFFELCQLIVDGLGMRASHHAEYASDTLAAWVGGSASATSMLDTLLLGDACYRTLRRAIRTDASKAVSPAAWHAQILADRQEISGAVKTLRQMSMRDSASLFASHPPNGLRAQLVESRSQISAAVVLTAADAAQIDIELAREYRSLRTTLANS